MHYLIRRSHWMQKHNFGVRCLGAHFVESTPGPPEHEKGCIDVSCHGHLRIQHVTRRSHQMKEHKFNVTCPPPPLFVEYVPVPPEYEKQCIIVFTAWSQQNAIFDSQIPLDVKSQVHCQVSGCAFCGIPTGPTRASKIVCRYFVSWTHQNAVRDP
jgi:hypothetical protein